MADSSIKQYNSLQYDTKPRYDTLQNTVQGYNNLPQAVYQADTISFSADNSPSEEKKKRKLSKGTKIAIGAGIVTALTIGADFLFCKGTHVKNLLGKFKGNKAKTEIKPEVNPEVKLNDESIITPTSPEPKAEPVCQENTTGRIRIAEGMMLPYDIIKGSEKQRNNLAQQYTDRIADKLAEKFAGMDDFGSLEPEELKEIIDSVLPAKINYTVLNRLLRESNFQNMYVQSISKNKLIYDQYINVPFLSKNWSATIIHEIRHFMDAITKPAHTVKHLAATFTGNFEEAIKIYYDVLYSKDKFTGFKKRTLKKFIKKLDTEDKIAILNCYREGMKTERNAYQQGHQFCQDKKSLLGHIMDQNTPEDFCFVEKINYVEDMLRNVIKKERQRMKRQFSRNKYKKLFTSLLPINKNS